MCISGIIDNEGRSACPICKQKIKFIDDIPACSQCRRLLYHNNAAEIQNKFYKTAEKMKNLADNNSEYLYKLHVMQTFGYFLFVIGLKHRITMHCYRGCQPNSTT